VFNDNLLDVYAFQRRALEREKYLEYLVMQRNVSSSHGPPWEFIHHITHFIWNV